MNSILLLNWCSAIIRYSCSSGDIPTFFGIYHYREILVVLSSVLVVVLVVMLFYGPCYCWSWRWPLPFVVGGGALLCCCGERYHHSLLHHLNSLHRTVHDVLLFPRGHHILRHYHRTHFVPLPIAFVRYIVTVATVALLTLPFVVTLFCHTLLPTCSLLRCCYFTFTLHYRYIDTFIVRYYIILFVLFTLSVLIYILVHSVTWCVTIPLPRHSALPLSFAIGSFQFILRSFVLLRSFFSFVLLPFVRSFPVLLSCAYDTTWPFCWFLNTFFCDALHFPLRSYFTVPIHSLFILPAVLPVAIHYLDLPSTFTFTFVAVHRSFHSFLFPFWIFYLLRTRAVLPDRSWLPRSRTTFLPGRDLPVPARCSYYLVRSFAFCQPIYYYYLPFVVVLSSCLLIRYCWLFLVWVICPSWSLLWCRYPFIPVPLYCIPTFVRTYTFCRLLLAVIPAIIRSRILLRSPHRGLPLSHFGFWVAFCRLCVSLRLLLLILPLRGWFTYHRLTFTYCTFVRCCSLASCAFYSFVVLTVLAACCTMLGSFVVHLLVVLRIPCHRDLLRYVLLCYCCAVRFFTTFSYLLHFSIFLPLCVAI